MLDKGGFLYDLDSEDILTVLGYEFVASGESSLSQEVALDVFGDGVGFEAVILDYVQILVSCVIGSATIGLTLAGGHYSNDIYKFNNKTI